MPKSPDRLVVDHDPNDPPQFGHVPEGWLMKDWIVRLRQLADRCEELQPGLAKMYRRWAKVLDGE